MGLFTKVCKRISRLFKLKWIITDTTDNTVIKVCSSWFAMLRYKLKHAKEYNLKIERSKVLIDIDEDLDPRTMNLEPLILKL